MSVESQVIVKSQSELDIGGRETCIKIDLIPVSSPLCCVPVEASPARRQPSLELLVPWPGLDPGALLAPGSECVQLLQ